MRSYDDHRLDLEDEPRQLGPVGLGVLSYGAILLVLLSLAAAVLNMTGEVAGPSPHPSVSIAPERPAK